MAGVEDTPYWTNREAIETEEVSASLTVLGGGSVGLELAQVFARFGSRVTVVEAADRLLPIEEPEASQVIEDVLRREGLEVRTGAMVTAAKREGDAIALALEGGERISSDRLLVATGRRANLAVLGLDNVGLDPNARFIPVDGRMRAADRSWAVGDATGRGAFTHVSMYQAQIATADILGGEGPEADYRALSRVTFTDPEVGSAGMTERQAREQGLCVVTGSAPVAGSARGWIHGPGSDGVIKLVADLDRGVLVGATAVGPIGGEVLSMLVLAIEAHVPIAALQRMIYAYPTFHRGIADALRALEGS